MTKARIKDFEEWVRSPGIFADYGDYVRAMRYHNEREDKHIIKEALREHDKEKAKKDQAP